MAGTDAAEQPPRTAVTIVNRDDLQRSRWTVGFRLIIAIPLLLWFVVWTIAAVLLAPVLWIATLVQGRPPAGLRDFYAAYVRFSVHLYAYMSLAANPYPGFLGAASSYPVDVVLPEQPAEQGRWGIAFRLLLALPPLLLAEALAGGGGGGGGAAGSDDWSVAVSGAGVLTTVAVLAWFAILARGRMPSGFEALQTYALGYAAQAYAYLFLLTDRYPDSHPTAAAPQRALAPHPIALTLSDDPRRNRLTVAFRLLLALPHIVWITLWAIVAAIVAIVTWFAALITGRPPAALHAFLARFVRYSVHLGAFIYVAGGPFPGFLGEPGYPVDVEIGPPAEQSRWVTGFRLILAIPALVVGSAIGGAALLAAVGAWFAALFTGRVPLGVRALIAYSLRYSAQTSGYLLLLTERYPYSAPGPVDREPAPEPAPERPTPEAPLTGPGVA